MINHENMVSMTAGLSRPVFQQSDCSFQKLLWHNLSWFLPKHRKMLFLRGFMFKPTEKA